MYLLSQSPLVLCRVVPLLKVPTVFPVPHGSLILCCFWTFDPILEFVSKRSRFVHFHLWHSSFRPSSNHHTHGQCTAVRNGNIDFDSSVMDWKWSIGIQVNTFKLHRDKMYDGVCLLDTPPQLQKADGVWVALCCVGTVDTQLYEHNDLRMR